MTDTARTAITAEDVQTILDNPRFVLVRNHDGSRFFGTEDVFDGGPADLTRDLTLHGKPVHVLLTHRSAGTAYGDHDLDSPTVAADLAEAINVMEPSR